MYIFKEYLYNFIYTELILTCCVSRSDTLALRDDVCDAIAG